MRDRHFASSVLKFFQFVQILSLKLTCFISSFKNFVSLGYSEILIIVRYSKDILNTKRY